MERTRLTVWMIALGSLVVWVHPASSSHSLIVNGDFELGNVNFFSEYEDHTYDPAFNRLDGGGRYMVRHTWNEGHPSWPLWGDHTSGSGLMLMANGAQNQEAVWMQSDIPVVPSTDYLFSYFLGAGLSNVSPAVIETSINGQVLGMVTQPTAAGPWWFEVSYIWNSGANTMATIALRDLETAWVGNDFALDDISLKALQIPAPGALFLGMTGAGLIGWLRRRRTV